MESLLHDAAHLAIVRLIELTDDTVSAQKMLLDEIRSVKPNLQYTAKGELMRDSQRPALLKVACSPYGKKALLRLLDQGTGHGGLEPDEQAIFNREVPAALVTSKKPAAVRRKEHLVYLRAPLLALCGKYTEELMRSRDGALVLEAVCRVYRASGVVEGIGATLTGDKASQELGERADDSEDSEDSEDTSESLSASMSGSSSSYFSGSSSSSSQSVSNESKDSKEEEEEEEEVEEEQDEGDDDENDDAQSENSDFIEEEDYDDNIEVDENSYDDDDEEEEEGDAEEESV